MQRVSSPELRDSDLQAALSVTKGLVALSGDQDFVLPLRGNRIDHLDGAFGSTVINGCGLAKAWELARLIANNLRPL